MKGGREEATAKLTADSEPRGCFNFAARDAADDELTK